jgi:hypothetical protein
VSASFSVKRGTRGKIAGIESEVMAPMQQQSAEIHARVTAAMQTDEDKAEAALDALLVDPGDALSDDFMLLESPPAGEPS